MATYHNILARLSCLFLLAAAACTTVTETPTPYHVVLRVDEVERAYSFTGPQTVAELLSRAELIIGEDDFLSHALDAPLSDGLIVRVERSAERTDCVLHPVPYGERRLPNELLAPGETRYGRVGKLGSERVCSFIQIRSGETRQTEISREIIESPRDQVIYYGSEREFSAIPITGTVAYLSHGSVWIMRESSEARRPISQAADADGAVFDLTPDGGMLLYTRRPNQEADNQLWLLRSTREVDNPALLLAPRNVMTAAWHSQDWQTIFFAHNGDDPALQRQRLDLTNGQLLQEEVAHPRLAARPRSQFALNDSGSAIAYAQPGELGIFTFTSGITSMLARYAPQYDGAGVLWLPPLSWSADESVLLTTLPAPTEKQPERFDIVAFFTEGRIRATLVADVGLAAIARHSTRASATIAYTRADESGYSLYIADRDGSNARLLFPDPEMTTARNVSDFAWSANGQQILAIADGNLWLVAADSGASRQLTGDGGIHALEWGP